MSKIEVAIRPNSDHGMIWFDGGLMQSAIDRFDGDYKSEKSANSVNGAYSIPYRIQPVDNALIIAPAGGREVRTALVWGARKVTGVELDYSVVQLVKTELNEYLGGIFRDGRVRIINDEGRSFVRRTKEKFDVIQFISAYSVTAVQSGAIDLASSYLVTEEAFVDYLDHLTEDGVLAIARDLNLRLFFTAWEVMESRSLDPRERLILLNGASLGRNTLLVKLEAFEADELKVIEDVCVQGGIEINYAPPALMNAVDRIPGLSSEPATRAILEKFIQISPNEREAFYSYFPYKVRPVNDDKPFFNDLRYLGIGIDEVDNLTTEEIKEYTDKTWYIPTLPIGYVPRLVVLVEAALFAMLFLIFPLWKWKSEGVREGWKKVSVLYFLSLGIGFIWIEIVLLKKFILFLGSPVYSISVVLASMLVSAGVGSLFSERLQMRLHMKAIFVFLTLTLLLAGVSFVYPPLLKECLGMPFAIRICVSALLIFPIGFVLGMPFPIGLQYLGEKSPESIPWAWAANGYATVLGVATAAFIAAEIGFSTLLWVSLGIYAFGFVSLSFSQAMPGRRDSSSI